MRRLPQLSLIRSQQHIKSLELVLCDNLLHDPICTPYPLALAPNVNLMHALKYSADAELDIMPKPRTSATGGKPWES